MLRREPLLMSAQVAVEPAPAVSGIPLPQLGADAVFAVIAGISAGALGWVLRTLVVVYSQRFHQLETKIDGLDAQLLEQEKEILRLRAELPVTYIRSDDFIRFVNTLDAKLDHLNRKLDGFLEARSRE